jgi:uroporphyrinogen-III synthase
VANCVLFPLSQRASHSLADELREEGVDVRIVEAYRTLPRQPPGPELDAIAGGVAAVVLASPTAVEVYTRHVAPALVGPAPPLFVVIGDTTANAARAAGLGNVTVAEGTETSELVGAVLSSLASAVELST